MENTENLENTERLDRPLSELPEEVEIIGVTFRNAGKIYYFDANGISVSEGRYVIVDTARGYEYGKVAFANRMLKGSEIVQPLRKVLRIADKSDERKYRENCQKESEAFDICLGKIIEHGLDMKLIDVEYTFDNSKLLFYFTSEDRVDFRELVKDLASVFRTRIELRQIGLRDETKIIGGFGICGREFCCHSFLGDFVQVSIKMAKEQNLSLNSSKISGACGRLMCCLRYEYDTYQEELKKTPKVDSTVITPDGPGVVVEAQPLSGLVKVRLDRDPDGTLVIYDRGILKNKDGEFIAPGEGSTVFSYQASTVDKDDKGDKGDKERKNEKSFAQTKEETLKADEGEKKQNPAFVRAQNTNLADKKKKRSIKAKNDLSPEREKARLQAALKSENDNSDMSEQSSFASEIKKAEREAQRIEEKGAQRSPQLGKKRRKPPKYRKGGSAKNKREERQNKEK